MAAEHSIFARELAALVLTLPVILIGAYLIWQTKKSRDWCETNGKILSSEKKQEGFRFTAVIRYSYLAHGVRCENSHITVCDWMLATGIIRVKKFVRLFPAGKEISVFFDDNKPGRAILYKTGYLMPALILGFGIVSELCLGLWIGQGYILPPELRPVIIHL
jgi:Protein of unknown function (DUF3592)